jgi:hypothetical protein
MSLYRIVEVPDPNGVLADLIEELMDNSALVEVHPDYEASAEALNRILESEGLNVRFDAEDMQDVVNPALGITEDTNAD